MAKHGLSLGLEHFRFSSNRENALSICFAAIPDAKPLRTFAGIALAFLIASATMPAWAEGIEVTMNQARIIKLSRAADTIIIGNPEIADASVQDASTVVLTGKGFGVTNLVILDDTGAPIIDEQVMVSRSTASTLRIYRRASVQTLSCTPYCESSYKTDAERQSEEDMSSE